jgi:hypothetical protein
MSRISRFRKNWHYSIVVSLVFWHSACQKRSFNSSSVKYKTEQELVQIGTFSAEKRPEDEATTVVTPPDPIGLEDMQKAADMRHSRDDVCADWEVAIHLMALVQSPRGRDGDILPKETYAKLLASCPGSYSKVAKELFKLQKSLKDYHTHFSAPSLESWYAPSITSCSIDAVCGQTVGGILLPLETAIGRHAYSMAWNSEGMPLFVDVLEVDGKPSSRVFEDLVASEDRSRQQDANAGQLSSYLFLKRALQEPKGEHKLLVKSVDGGQLARMTVSFDTTKASRLPQGWHYFMKFATNRTDYACDKVSEGSNDVFGACILDGNRGIVWLRSFQVGAHDFFKMLRKFIKEHPVVSKKPILLDLRGNGGGYPELAAQLACMVSGMQAAEKMENTVYIGSIWPGTLELSDGSRISTQSMDLEGNGDLVMAEKSRIASSLNPLLKREEFNLSFFRRFERAGSTLSTKGRCVDLHDSTFQKLRWVVLTSGREFSATENFLNFVQSDNNRVVILGRVSTGGTGAPISVKLPKTGMSIRLSQARQLDIRTGQWPIEGFGVRPDKKTEGDTDVDFERYLTLRAKGPVSTADKTLRPLIVRQGLLIDALPD